VSDLEFKPDYRIHPKETLKEYLDLAEHPFILGEIESKLIAKVLDGGFYTFKEAGILAKLTPYNRAMWINLQTNYLTHPIESTRTEEMKK
jgi:hypothetical protein